MSNTIDQKVEKLAGDYADHHSFRVPYDGTKNFYDDKDFKCSKAGFIAGYKAAVKNKVSETIEFAEWLLKNNMSPNGFGGWGGGRLNVNYYGSKTSDLYKIFLKNKL